MIDRKFGFLPGEAVPRRREKSCIIKLEGIRVPEG